jgi:hypothetical protein
VVQSGSHCSDVPCVLSGIKLHLIHDYIICYCLLGFKAFEREKGRHGKKGSICKVRFFSISVYIKYDPLKISPKFVGSRVFVEIDNATYYIDALSGYTRDEAKMTCKSMNMTMISFEGDEQKWRSINGWLADSSKAKK